VGNFLYMEARAFPRHAEIQILVQRMQTTSTHIFLCKEKKERQGGKKKKKKNLRKQNQETLCRNRKTPAFENNEPEQKLSARRNDQSNRYLYLPQTALCLCPCLYLSVRFSSISLLCRQGQKQVKFESYLFANFGDLEIYLCYN
jgi:hypothetical protein